jgi:DNA-binding GntR family transcriptional regulator
MAVEQHLRALDTRNLREQARQVIRMSITTGEIVPGEIFSVSFFATRLGVSATPVREALWDLVNEGLLTVVRNRGFRVQVLSKDEVADLLEIRLMLEVPAVGQVAQRITPELLEKARQYAIQTIRAAAHNNYASYMEADVQFHQSILAAVSNRKLIDEIERLRSQTRLYSIRELSTEDGSLSQSAAEHLELVEALAQKDRERAADVTRRHLQWIHRQR